MQVGTRNGQVLAAKYRLEELLGSGGMGHVYRAVNEDVGRTVAIKILRSEHASNASLVERFLREARAANLVRHPNVVDVLDIGRDADGSPFIVQELLRGQDLAKYVEDRGGKLTLDEIERFVLPVIDAVAEAHAQGVIHRDIKPENVFLADQGKQKIPKLLDFGISKLRLPDIRMTEVGVMMGTPAYMAPEQVQGSRDADARTDVWALGVVLFELIAGHLPFDATDAPALFVAIATKDVPRLADVCPGIHPDIARVCDRCLRRMPDERYPSALELSRDLRHVFEGSAIEPTQRHPQPEAWVKRTAKHGGMDVPDLELPSRPNALAVAKTVAHPPAARAPVTPAAAATRAGPASTFDDRVTPDAPYGAELELTPGGLPSRSPRATAASPSARSPVAPDQAMSGLMLAGPTTASPRSMARRPSSFELDRGEPPAIAPGPDVPFLIALSVVGLVTIGATAILTAFIHQPGGLQLVSLVTKPTPTTNLLVHGGLAMVALFLGGRAAVGGVRKWRDYDGGRTAAVFAAVFAGAMLFVAIELMRASF